MKRFVSRKYLGSLLVGLFSVGEKVRKGEGGEPSDSQEIFASSETSFIFLSSYNRESSLVSAAWRWREGDVKSGNPQVLSLLLAKATHVLMFLKHNS